MSRVKYSLDHGETQNQATTTVQPLDLIHPSPGNQEQTSQTACSSKNDMDHKPGHFHLPLTIRCPSSDQRYIQSKEARLSDQLNNKDEVECTKLALWNLISMFKYALQRTDEAMKTIHCVLDKDPNNLNALQNLAYINKELGMENEAKQLEEKLQSKIDVTTSEPEVKARVARSMAEQGFALTYDCFVKDDDDKGIEQVRKYQMADTLYQNAIKIGNGVVDAEERMTWSFFKAFNHQQICGQYNLLSDEKENMTEHLGKSIASYKDVLQQQPTPLYRAQTLVYLTSLQSRTRTDYYVRHTKDLLPIISKYEEKIMTLLDGEGSVSYAISLVRDNHRVLNTMANALNVENAAEAEEVVNASLETESDPKINWCGYHLRGKFTLEKYMRNKGSVHSQRDLGNIQLLKNSILDLKTSLEGMHSSKNYYLLGKATMKLAEVERARATPLTDNCSIDRMTEALTYFNEALKVDQGQRDAKLHSFRAQCLQRLGEDRQAVESWKRAVELDRQSASYLGNIELLLTLLLKLCKEFCCDLEQRQPVVAETATYLKVALSKYETVYDRFIPKLIERFPEEFLQAADYFKITNDFTMARKILEEVHHVSQKGILPRHQEIEERRRRIEEEIEECQEDLANVGIQEPERSEDEQTADSDVSEEGATGDEVLDERLPATEKQREFMPTQVEKAKNTKGFPYDFFVIHSPKDAEWVNYTLLAKLEGEEGLKGCIADRDFKLGKYVLDNITAAVKDSAKVLIILTPDLVQSRWCEHEMKTAFHENVEKGTKSVTPVLLMDCEVPDELEKITYLDAREHFDWEHLLRDIQE